LIGLAKVSLDRTTDLGCALERRRPFTPWAETAAAIPTDRGFEILTGARHQVGDPPAHAKAQYANAAAVDKFARS
jgi:hypothetical protein